MIGSSNKSKIVRPSRLDIQLMEAQHPYRNGDWLLFLVTIVIVSLPTAMVARLFLGGDWAFQVGFIIGFAAGAFVIESGRRAWTMAAMFALNSFGLNYYRYVRQDAIGIGVCAVCLAMAILIVWPLIRRRRELQRS